MASAGRVQVVHSGSSLSGGLTRPGREGVEAIELPARKSRCVFLDLLVRHFGRDLTDGIKAGDLLWRETQVEGTSVPYSMNPSIDMPSRVDSPGSGWSRI